MIFGEKSCLRRPEREDYGKIWMWWNDPEIERLTNLHGFPPAFETVENYYNKSLSSKEQESFIIHALDKNIIGTIDLYNIRWINRSSSVGIIIGEKEYWGKGYGKDALLALINFAFNDLDFRRIELKVIEYNKRAIRCFEKCGFQVEGYLRDRIFRDGVYHNQYLMSILKEEIKT